MPRYDKIIANPASVVRAIMKIVSGQSYDRGDIDITRVAPAT